MDTEAAETLRGFADENGFISRNSMRAALVATLGDTVSDADVDVVMEKINGGGGNSVVSVTEVEAVCRGGDWPPPADAAPWLKRRWSVLDKATGAMVSDVRVRIDDATLELEADF